MSDGTTGDAPDHNVYTLLLIVATVFVVGATIYMGIRGQQLFGSWNPFVRA